MASHKRDLIWKVFVPHDLLTLPNGMLIGHVQEEVGLLYVASVCNSAVTSPNLIGSWTNGNSMIPKSSLELKELYLSLFRSKTGQISCQLIIQNCKVPNNCIIFSPNDLVKSYFITSKDETSQICHGDKEGLFQTLLHSMECSEKEAGTTASRHLGGKNFHNQFILSWLIGLFLPLDLVLNNK